MLTLSLSSLNRSSYVPDLSFCGMCPIGTIIRENDDATFDDIFWRSKKN